MVARVHSASRGIVAGFAVLSLAVAAGFVVGYCARPASAPDTAQLSASQSVESRFPDDWRDLAASPPGDAFASADALWFQPTPLYPIRSEPETIAAAAEDLTASVPDAAVKGHGERFAKLDAGIVKRRSNAVLSEPQIAGIKNRLNLTTDQERYWPAIAAELRKMEYKKEKSAQGTRTASVDMSKVNVAGLKSAGLPLVMSFDDEQRRELKDLAHLLGIESALPGL
jgi:hypothetical protein